MPAPIPTRRALVAAGLALPLAARAQPAGAPVVVASKLDAEGGLLGAMILRTLTAAGIPTTDRLQLGPTRIVRAALVAGEIDIYPEYTGNGAFFFGPPEDPAWRDAEAAFALVQRRDAEANQLVWLDRARANNTWAIAVAGDLARRENLRTLPDFAAAATAGRLRLAASAEFVESPAALPAFERTYGFTFPRDRIVILPGGDTAVTLRAAAQGIGGVNAGMAYGTDGAIAALGLVLMADPQGAQLVFEPAPVIRRATLERQPRIAALLAPVFQALDGDVLRQLNARVAVEGRPVREVANAFLASGGFVR